MLFSFVKLLYGFRLKIDITKGTIYVSTEKQEKKKKIKSQHTSISRLKGQSINTTVLFVNASGIVA